MKEFSFSLIEKVFYSFIFIFVSLGVFRILPTGFNEKYYLLIANWLTFLALFLGFFMNFYRAFILKPFRSNKFFIFLIFLSLLFFIFAGQKISWGREIMGDYLEHIVPRSLVTGIILLYLIVVPILYRLWKKGEYWLDFLGIPVPKIFHLVLFIMMVILASKTDSPLSEIVLELGFSWIVFLMMWRPYNKKIYKRTTLKR